MSRFLLAECASFQTLVKQLNQLNAVRVRMTKDPPLTSRLYVRSIPTGIGARAGFDSGRDHCGDWNGMGRARCRGAC
jgi:hypothetical protein